MFCPGPHQSVWSCIRRAAFVCINERHDAKRFSSVATQVDDGRPLLDNSNRTDIVKTNHAPDLFQNRLNLSGIQAPEVMVFWDIENIAMWRRFGSAASMMATLEGVLEGRRIARVTAVGELSRKLSRAKLAELQRHGVQTVDCSLGHRNAADLVLVAEMMRCFAERRPKCICLISNDGGFAHVLTTLRQMGCHTVLLHDQANVALVRTAMQSIHLGALGPASKKWRQEK